MRVAVIVALALAPVAWGQDPAQAAVKEAFLGYKTAILGGDGKTAVQHVSRSTIDMFGDTQQHALYSPAADVRGQSMMNRLQILSLRHRLTPAQLKEMSPTQLFVYGVDKGWIGKESVVAAEPGAATVTGDSATLEILQGLRPTGQKFSFVREEGRWRFDLVPILALGNVALKTLASRQGLGEDELIFGMLEAVSGKAVPATIWEPPFKR
jgi:hypothetical protein